MNSETEVGPQRTNEVAGGAKMEILYWKLDIYDQISTGTLCTALSTKRNVGESFSRIQWVGGNIPPFQHPGGVSVSPQAKRTIEAERVKRRTSQTRQALLMEVWEKTK